MNKKNNGNLFELVSVEDFIYEINSICKMFGLEKFTKEELIALYADYKDPKKQDNKFVEFMEACFGPRYNKRPISNDPLKEPTDRISKLLVELLGVSVDGVKEKNTDTPQQKPKELYPYVSIDHVIVDVLKKPEEKCKANENLKPDINSTKTVREKVSENKKKVQAKEPVKEEPVKKNTKIIPPSFEEIKKQLDYAVLNRNKESRPGATYESGVEAALKWVAGLNVNKPLVDKFIEFVVVNEKTINLIKNKFEKFYGKKLTLSLEDVSVDNTTGTPTIAFTAYSFGDMIFKNGDVIVCDDRSIGKCERDEFKKVYTIIESSKDGMCGKCNYVKK